ncbi:pollen receptor-like kinase 1 [Impatiens glandulifera]|uniref:pollen receptor-like kinase 1 n=1 Tax=Impatiens glandulifera TaxID=253017 RepID=UPI001FB13023|nr:pollen receptor-like kinase 1 [Impatiens glandulifera]
MTFNLTAIIPTLSFFFLIILLQSTVVFSVTESEALLTFKNSLISNHSAFTTWKLPKTPCTGNKANWVGILCQKDHVLGIQLEGMGISGIIHVESLQALPHLRTMSLSNNNLEGKLPKLNKLGLRSIYLSSNKFSGEIDGDCFDGMMSLKKVYLEKNVFTGQIPISLTMLPKLVELNIEGNQFSGAIPTFKSVQFKILNLSNNKLEGQVPNELNYLTAQSFAGNPGLCGPPLQACTSNTNSNSNSKSTLSTIIKIILICVAILIAISIFMIIFLTIKKNGESTSTLNMEAPPPMRSKPMPESIPDQGSPARSKKSSEAAGKLVFLKEDREKFELPDLLKSSAEMLGNGCLGAYYKACLPSGKPMVVKRFKHMNNVGREEFQEHMWRIGRLNHPNLLSPVAFYYRKEEKLTKLIYVIFVLKNIGKGSKDQQSLNWAGRLKIVKGVAKGLMYLHTELPSLIVPHGHLKSSNVLLTESLEPLLSDYALIPVVNPDHAQKSMQAYKSPEYKNNNRVTKKADVWCLGVVILETLTAKSPGSDADMVTWVNSLANKNATEVFDKKLMETKHNEGEMTKLFKIGLSCVELDAEKRSDMKEIVKKIDELKE